MLKLIRFTQRDLSDIVNGIPDISDSVRKLFEDIMYQNDCSYVDFMYNTMVNHNRLYKETEFRLRPQVNTLQSKTLILDLFELMLAGYAVTDCPLSDKYSGFLYDDLLESMEDLHGKVVGVNGDPMVEYEHRVRMEHLMGVLEIVTYIDNYIESTLKGALMGYGDISSILITIAQDGDSLYLILSDEFTNENSGRY